MATPFFLQLTSSLSTNLSILSMKYIQDLATSHQVQPTASTLLTASTSIQPTITPHEDHCSLPHLFNLSSPMVLIQIIF